MPIIEANLDLIGGIYRLILVIGSATALVLAFNVFQRWHLVSAKALTLALLASAEIQICFFMESFSPDPEMAFFWARMRFLGLVFILPFTLLYVFDLTGGKPLSHRSIAALMIVPILTTGVIWWGDLATTAFFKGWTVTQYGTLTIEHTGFFGWYPVFGVFSAVLMIVIVLRLVQYIQQNSGMRRKQALWMLISLLVGYSAAIPGTFFYNPFMVNLTPIGMSIFSFTAGWAFRQRLLNLLPIAYEAILQNMQSAVLVLNTQHEVVGANPAARTLFQQPILEGLPVQALGLEDAFLQPFVNLDPATHWETQTTIGSDQHLYEITVSPVMTRTQEIYGQIIMFRDIEQKRQAEQALQESEARYRMMVESPLAGIYILNEDHKLTYANHELVRILGATPEQLMGQNVTDFMTAESVQTMQSEYVNAMQEQARVRRYEDLTLVGLDGKPHRVQAASTSMTTASGQTHVIGQIVDVTTRKATEQALQESEARYRAVIEASMDAYFLLESVRDSSGNIVDFRIVQANDKAIHELNAPYDRWMNGSFCEFFPMACKDGTLERYKQVVSSGQTSEMDFEIQPGRPAAGWYESQVVRVGDGVAVMHHNITERKEIARREMELTLEKERMRILSTFIEKASHEFRTPLTVILSSGSFMAKLDDPVRRQAKATRIEQQVMRMTKLVDMLLVMTRLESQSTIEMFSVNVGRVMRAECQTLMDRYGDLPKLQYEVPDNLPFVQGNMTDLADAFQQILDNAYRYTPREGSITVRSGVNEETVWLEIRDTGIGISEEAMPHIFETFWRQDEPHSTPGFGLGLSIAQRVMEIHHGSIQVTSEIGSGTTVRLTLPISTARIRVWS
jgi:PAS domain S-box-containing protein